MAFSIRRKWSVKRDSKHDLRIRFRNAACLGITILLLGSALGAFSTSAPEVLTTLSTVLQDAANLVHPTSPAAESSFSPLYATQNFYDWSGWAGNNTIYPTQYPNAIYLQPESTPGAWQNGTNDTYWSNYGCLTHEDYSVENAIQLATPKSDVPFYQFIGHNIFILQFWLVASGVSQNYYWSPACGYLGEDTTQAIQTNATYTGLSSVSNSPTSLFYEANSGTNVTQTSYNEGTSPNAGLSALSLGLDLLGAFTDGAVGLGVTVASAYIDYSGLVGALQTGPNGVSCSSGFSGSGSLCQVSQVYNGSTTLYNAASSNWYLGQPCIGSGQCGSNVFSQVTSVESELNGSFLGNVIPGTVSFQASNIEGVGNGYGPIQATSVSTTWPGAQTSNLTYAIDPAISIGGTVTEYKHGPAVAGATVELSQTCGAPLITNYFETTNQNGYWHFFAQPGCDYYYAASAPNPYQGGTIISPSIALSYTSASDTGANYVLPLTLAGGFANFTESGIPAGDSWSVTMNGASVSAGSGSTIAFLESNGTGYSYTVAGPAGYTASPASGSVSISGTSSSVAVSFSTSYTVTFTESGSPVGDTWDVTLNGVEQGSSTSTVVFSELSGTYSYTVSPASGYGASPSSGQVTVAKTAVGVTIKMTHLKFTAKYSETGLPSGYSWWVDVNGTKSSTSSSSISFTEYDGGYSVSAGTTDSGYGVFPAWGWLDVSGANQSQSMTIGKTQTATFTESGLPSGTSWAILMYADGDDNSSSATGSKITFNLAPGGYSWDATDPSVNSAGYYSPSPGSGSINVTSSSISQSISYTLKVVTCGSHVVACVPVPAHYRGDLSVAGPAPTALFQAARVSRAT